MSQLGFGTLALLVVVGLAGPLLAGVPRLGIPVVVGELIAGIVIGRTGFNLIDPADPTFELFANIGFTLVMFVVGTHVPVRDGTLRTAIPKALLRAAAVGAVAAVLGVLLARAFGTGHPLLYAVLMASSSAALALPVIDSLGLSGPPVLSTSSELRGWALGWEMMPTLAQRVWPSTTASTDSEASACLRSGSPTMLR